MTNIKEDYYGIFWKVGALISYIIYFSGTFFLYSFYRKKYVKKFRNIILTYHRINDNGKDRSITVSTKNFKKQMDYLCKNFSIVSLETIYHNIKYRKNLNKDNVAISFDDGYKDNYYNAFPILKKKIIPATLFIITDSVGKSKEILNIEEITDMKNNGISFGSHTASHKVLVDLERQSASEEIIRSKKELELMIGEKVKYFAYPKGKKKHFNKYIKQIVDKAGYKGAFTTENHSLKNNIDLFEINRLGVRDCSLTVFKVRLSGIFENTIAYYIRSLFRLT